jgi:hypothetical protein
MPWASSLVACLVLLAQTGCSGVRPIPVMIGGDPALDACGGLGVVSGEEAGGRHPVPVRTGPGPQHSVVDSLAEGATVWLCDRRDGWIGIVYGAEGQDCQVSTPVADEIPYAGDCRSGWVEDRHVRLTAG